MRQRRRIAVALSLCTALGLIAAACGSDNSSSSSGGATTTAAAATTAGGAATTRRRAATTAGGAGATTTAAGGTGTCKAGTGTVPPIQTGTADGKGKTVGLLFDVTGRGDKSFNDAAAAALDKAKADYGITGQESTPTAADGSDRPERMKAFIGERPHRGQRLPLGRRHDGVGHGQPERRSTPSSTRS